MKSSDKLLFGIVGGIVVLVIAAFAVVLSRPAPTYREDSTPAGVVHNYLLALRQRDYQRAYRYLSNSLSNYPASEEQFHSDIARDKWSFPVANEDNITFEIGEVIETAERAEVSVIQTHYYNRDLFDTGQNSRTFPVILKREAGEWRITFSEENWSSCWESKSSCR